MNKRTLAVAILLGGLAANAAAADGDARQDPVAAFFKGFNAQPDTFAEYRFLASPGVQGDPQARNMASQMMATHLSFLGRPVDALQAFPFRRADDPNAAPPAPPGWTAVPANEWITGQAASYRVVMVNEAHHAPQTRVLTLSLLEPLRAKGFTHLAIEALLNDGTDPMPGGYPVRKTGIYTREPVFAELLREALRLGYRLVPYETASTPGEPQQDRETGQARAIAAVLGEDPQAKVLVHAGYAHIGEAPGSLPEGARPMAMELARISGLPLLTVDQTSPRSYETADIDTIGQRLAMAFAVREPTVLVAPNGDQAWSNKPGLYDASVLLPPATGSSLRPDWLSLDGARVAVAIDLAPCLGHMPCLAEARHAREGEDAIPADQFLMLATSEQATALFLAPGEYRLRLLGADGGTLLERSLHVPAHGTAATSARTP